MQKFVFLSLLITSLVLLQCESQSSSATDKATDSATATTETTTTPPTTSEAVSSPYPSITQEKMMNLYENCDYIDFVFYGTNFSMSQNQQPAIRSTLGGVSTTPAKVVASCQPVGRVFFQIDGQNAEEADLFFGGSCLYYLFLENGSYAYGNQLTEEGFAFYTKIFEQASTRPAQ